jgi:hypothetical protein
MCIDRGLSAVDFQLSNRIHTKCQHFAGAAITTSTTSTAAAATTTVHTAVATLQHARPLHHIRVLTYRIAMPWKMW